MRETASSLITLGVDDLQPGLRLALWPRASLARDAGLPLGRRGAMDLCLAHNVATKAEVDTVMADAAAAGGAIVKPAQQTFWGSCAGYFEDPDQHLWEVAWIPRMPPRNDLGRFPRSISVA